jgi:hypothetical protein
MIRLERRLLLTTELVQDKKEYDTNNNDFNGRYDLSGRGPILVPGFGSSSNNAAALSVAKAKNVQVLRVTLIADLSVGTALASSNEILAQLTVQKLKCGVEDIVKIAILALVASGSISTDHATRKSVVTEQIHNIR